MGAKVKAKGKAGHGVAVGYIRVSTEGQATEGVSLEAQRARIRAAAEAAGLRLARIVEDPAVSGASTLASRPGGAHLCAMLANGEARTVIVAKLDRLGRSAVDLQTTVQGWEREGVALIALDVGVDTSTPSGRVMLGMLALFAQFEREQIGERTRAGLAQARAEGAHLGAPAFGSTRGRARDAAGRLAVVEAPAEAAALARLLKLRREGSTWRGVADALNAAGVPSKRGGRWHAAAAMRIGKAHGVA